MPPTNDSAVEASVAHVQELPMFGFSAGSCSMTGDYREGNEDSLYVSRWSLFVADGVGGLAAGEVASSIVTHRIGALLENTHGKVTSAERLHEILAKANFDLARRALGEPPLKGMATTFTGVFSDGAIIRVAHVGDSRAYRLSEGRLTQATRDDSYIQNLIDAGTLTVDAARTHPSVRS
ncbi:PP2C family protein-serine/threonine phosphatase [Leifsonia xyli]|uniref:PP2C family protein-serine/threonine phosphatase n=1 Tax=Leifsonia xyli TaxID=1575 RepID=UPI003D6737B9